MNNGVQQEKYNLQYAEVLKIITCDLHFLVGALLLLGTALKLHVITYRIVFIPAI